MVNCFMNGGADGTHKELNHFNPLVALPLPLFAPLYVGNWESQFGHTKRKLNGLLLLASPSM